MKEDKEREAMAARQHSIQSFISFFSLEWEKRLNDGWVSRWRPRPYWEWKNKIILFLIEQWRVAAVVVGCGWPLFLVG